MNNKSTSPSGSLSLRAITIIFCALAAFSILTGTVLAFLRPEGQAKVHRGSLTFEERLAYQQTIEEIYWRHRIWPKERPDPKPSLDAVMSHAQLERKVADYLRNSQALEDYWQRPITSEQLQAEMNRMAQHTKQPEVLRELFEALGNDPFVIAECLARTALAERLLRSWYAHDQRIHGDLKRHAEAELESHPTIAQMKQLSGKYSEIELVRSDSAPDKPNYGGEHGLKLDSLEWDETVQKLAAMFGDDHPAAAGVPPAQPTRLPPQKPALAGVVSPANGTSIIQIKTGVLSSLQEDESRYSATAIVEKTNDRLKLATVTWVKEPLELWLAKAERQVSRTAGTANASYTLPGVSDGNGCINDTWTATASAPDGRGDHTAVWTGSEMIIWGGASGSYLNTGGRYNPSTDSWTTTSTTDAPAGRVFHTAVWTGSEMIVWGGADQCMACVFNTGGRYNPGTNTWVATSMVNAPTARAVHTAVWTGSEMIIWGGVTYDGLHARYLDTGGKYNPSTDSWTATSTTNAPDGRDSHTAVWTDTEMIVWGGSDGNDRVNTGGRYNSSMDSWTTTGTANAPIGRVGHTAVWTGGEMIIWGGADFGNIFNTGGRYNPGTNSWTATMTNNAPDARYDHTAVWTGNEMIVWGGFSGFDYLNTGGRYDPGMDSWTATSTTNAPDGRSSHTVVWTGTEMIVWGGSGNAGLLNTGGRYCAHSGPTPTPTPCIGRCEPTPRPRPTPRVRPTPR